MRASCRDPTADGVTSRNLKATNGRCRRQNCVGKPWPPQIRTPLINRTKRRFIQLEVMAVFKFVAAAAFPAGALRTPEALLRIAGIQICEQAAKESQADDNKLKEIASHGDPSLIRNDSSEKRIKQNLSWIKQNITKQGLRIKQNITKQNLS